ncbi:unknown protein [Microcystis aeruginosa NIES-843]|uniref:Uncharacterized protein n=1 Tax=Microcystis aeruginosa (strain NIES-843 / IAM M-2473) TaxID=449447 RepID=B0JWE1_MICAN|nr:unknown protein [Microcystis aeruginosa NIES-843]
MRLAIITQRFSWDNFPSKGSSKFSGGVEGNSILRYISTNERRCKGDARVLSDSSRFKCIWEALNQAKSPFL